MGGVRRSRPARREVAAALAGAPAGALRCRASRFATGAGAGWVGRTDDLGVEGYRFVVERPAVEELRRALAAAGAVAVERAAGEAVRVESGQPAFPIDMDRDTIPLEAGIADRAISFDKGCYVGQEVIVRILHRGQAHRTRLVGLNARTPAAANRRRPAARRSSVAATRWGA